MPLPILDPLQRLTASHGALQAGRGPAAGVVALDRNVAAPFAFIDHLFGTAVPSDRTWPDPNGVFGDHVPSGFFKQLRLPFTSKDKPPPAPDAS